MATTEDKLVIRQLESARRHLQARGDADAVKSLDAIIDRLGDEESAPEISPEPTKAGEDLLTAQDAASLLGVTSVSPIWTWVGQGKLTYRRLGAFTGITRESVEKLLRDPALEAERKYAAELDRVLAPFDATDEDLAEMYDWWPVTRGSSD
jgi:hypothetical protein